jgi:hypothetical protein
MRDLEVIPLVVLELLKVLAMEYLTLIPPWRYVRCCVLE